MPGMLIAFEGIDGSGKSTIARMVYKELLSHGVRCEFTVEPTDKSLGVAIRRELANNSEKLHAMTLQILFTADRSEHVVSFIRPKMEEGAVVITDRYYWSTIAYGAALGLDMQWLTDMNSIFPKPDLTFWFRVSTSEAGRRSSQRHLKETMEVDSIQRKVALAYALLSEKNADSWRIIDAEKPIDDVMDQVMRHLNILVK